MLFITPRPKQEAKDYFTQHMDRADYYLNDAPEMPGEWHGMGAELLGLSGTVDKERYFQLCDNINPATGESLTPHTKTNRRILYDFTFDAPKSVSLAYELGGDERVMDAFRAAVKDTMSEMEGAMMARVRSNKRRRGPRHLQYGLGGIHPPHDPARGRRSRSAAPLSCGRLQLRPMTRKRTNGRPGSSQIWSATRAIIRRHSIAGSRNSLADLGYGIERDGNSFRLAGIDPATADKFSRRSEIIEAEAERLGITDAKAKGELGQTHARKQRPGRHVRLRSSAKHGRRGSRTGNRTPLCEARRGQEGDSPGRGGKRWIMRCRIASSAPPPSLKRNCSKRR